MLGNLGSSSKIVSTALFASVNTAHCHAMSLVEKGHGFAVLAFVVLDNQPMIWIVGVNGKFRGAALSVRITKQPIEAILPL